MYRSRLPPEVGIWDLISSGLTLSRSIRPADIIGATSRVLTAPLARFNQRAKIIHAMFHAYNP